MRSRSASAVVESEEESPDEILLSCGARMTGGGFGGCTINLVRSERVEAFQAKVVEGYGFATGRRPDIYVCTAADGVRRAA